MPNDNLEIPMWFKDPQGTIHVVYNFEDFCEAMGHSDWHLCFDIEDEFED